MDTSTSSDGAEGFPNLPQTGPTNDVAEVTEYDEAAYLPRKRRTHGIVLCLSGGGFRAALFHLGALRRLNELGVLSKVETISSVSGGSIIAAYMAQALPSWPRPGEIIPADTWEEIAQPFREFTRQNLRTGPLLKRLW